MRALPRRAPVLLAAGVLAGVTSAVAGDARPAVVRLGAGGYRLTRPAPCKPLPGKVHKTASFTKPVITGQWWSSLLWQKRKFSQPLFAHPLAVRCAESGLTVSYPGTHIRGTRAGIFGAGLGKNGDFTLGISTAAKFRSAECDGYSDWFVSALFRGGEASMRVSFGHGSPFVYCIYEGGDPVASFDRPPRVWSGGAGGATLAVTVGDRHYGLFGATGSTWTGVGGAKLTNASRGKRYFSVAVLPDSGAGHTRALREVRAQPRDGYARRVPH